MVEKKIAHSMASIYFSTMFLMSFALGIFGTCAAQINNASSLDTVLSDRDYSFVVGGHYYGNSSNQTGLPANTVLANIEMLNSPENAFHVILGDVFLDVKNDFPLYSEKFFPYLNRPVLIAVGNHDISGTYFEENVGPTYFKFNYGADLHIVINTEQDDGSIVDEQLEFLSNACSSEAKNIFIYSHRPIWSEDNENMEGIFIGNTVSVLGNNFADKVLPILEAVDSNTNVYWLSGSLGGNAPASFFYHKSANIHFVQTAIRGLKRDGILKVTSTNGTVSFTPMSLTGEKLSTLEGYNLDFWRNNHPEKEFNFRLTKLYLKNIVLHRHFWYGAISMLAVVLVLMQLLKRRRKTKNNG
jgi:hypothetical protein